MIELRRLRAAVIGAWITLLLFAGLIVIAGPQVAGWLSIWAMEGVGAVLATIVLIGAGVFVGQRAVLSVRWVRPIRLPSEPTPEHWPDLIRGNVPLSRRLTDAHFEKLLRLVQLFVRKKRFEGAQGFEVTEEVKVTIAAQACLLLLDLDVGLFPGLHTIIVYPAAFVPRRVGESGGRGRKKGVATFGESWSLGVVVLSWDSVLHGAFDPKDGRNVVLHEFAHQLDQATGEADGVPVGISPSTVKTWAGVLGRRHGQLRRAKRRGRSSVMNKYGAKNRAEFFAVATETFLEKPHQLKTKKTDLYDSLVEFYGWDPIEELRARGTSGIAAAQ